MNAVQSLISAQHIADIVDEATRAPSAENTQPWKVSWDGERLEVRHDRSKQMASDVGSMLDLTGVGALVESLVLASSTQGLRAAVDVGHEIGDTDGISPVVASITLERDGRPDPLAGYLSTRCTTRRMDKRRKISAAHRGAIEAAAQVLPGVRVHWIADQDIRAVSRLIGLANRLRFEHREFQQELYGNMRFTPAEAEHSRDGLDVATMQLPWGVGTLMWLLRKWPRARFANALGFSRSVGVHAAQEVRASGAIGVLSVDQSRTTTSSFVDGGRALQRAWLEATRLGLAFHPTAGLPVFVAYAERTAGDRIPQRYQQMAVSMASRFRSIMPEIDGRTPQMLFRVGYGERPRVNTLRRDCLSLPTIASIQEKG